MEIVPGVHLVDEARGCNIYLLVAERLTLVDTGLRGDLPAIERYVKDIGRSPAEIDLVILTHYHPDHIGALPQLRRRYGCRVAIHKLEAPYIEHRISTADLRVWGVAGVALSLSRPFALPEPVPVALPLTDGETLPVLGGATVIHTPGHTAGSICLHLPELRLLFTGDALVHVHSRIGVPGFPFTADRRLGRHSLSRLAALPADALCFGHGPPLARGGDKAFSTFLQAGMAGHRAWHSR